MTFARRVFLVAGVYGLVVLLPMYFMESRIGHDFPPPITHPDNFYGFVGTAVAWQLVFLVLATNPLGFRLIMLPAVVEKITYGVATLVLFAQGRIPGVILVFGTIDLFWAALFAVAFAKTSPAGQRAPV